MSTRFALVRNATGVKLKPSPFIFRNTQTLQTATKAILDSNAGRDPERLTLKFAAMRADPFAFFRATCPLFYSTLPLARSLKVSPNVLACGDLHLENFGSYKGNNRLVYFDVVDFDESCVAPVAFELVRLLTSMLVGARPLNISASTASKMVNHFVQCYAANVMAAKPRWVERSLATGPVRKLLQSLKGRHRCDLIKQRTFRKSGKIRLLNDGKKSLAIASTDRTHAESILAAYASTQRSPAFFEPIDIARRVAGSGSLGLERYVALVRGDGSVDGQYLIDIKIANASALAASIKLPQPRWKSEAERVVSIQRVSQAIFPALLGSVRIGSQSYVIKELAPTTDRVNLVSLAGKSAALIDVVQTMAETTAWGHLRGCSRFGAAPVETLADFVRRDDWHRQLICCADAAHELVSGQWEKFSMDYDTDPEGLVSALFPA